MSLVEVMMAIGIMSVAGLGYMKMNENQSKSLKRHAGMTDANSFKMLIEGSLIKSEKCEAAFAAILENGGAEVDLSSSFDETLTSEQVGTFTMGTSTEMAVDQSYGKLKISGYNLELKYTEGNSYAESTFTVDTTLALSPTQTMPKRVKVNVSFDVAGGKLVSCSALGGSGNEACDVLDGQLNASNGNCEDINLYGEVTNNGTIRGGQIKGISFEGGDVVTSPTEELADSYRQPCDGSGYQVSECPVTEYENPTYFKGYFKSDTTNPAVLDDFTFLSPTFKSTRAFSEYVKNPDEDGWADAATHTLNGIIVRDYDGREYEVVYKCLTISGTKFCFLTLDPLPWIEIAEAPSFTTPTSAPSVPECFLAGTDILVGDKMYKNIEDIIVGDTVLSFDGKKVVQSKVSKIMTSVRTDGYLQITLSNEKVIRVTDDHPFYVSGKYIPAGKLTTKSKLSMIGEKDAFVPLEITSIKRVKKVSKVYNMTVDGNHNYFAEGVLVHNKSVSSPPSSPSSPSAPDPEDLPDTDPAEILPSGLD